jgi:sodium/proline symporter
MIAGAVTVIVWKQLSGGIFDIYEILPGFILASASILGVSLSGKAPDDALIEIHVQVEKG